MKFARIVVLAAVAGVSLFASVQRTHASGGTHTATLATGTGPLAVAQSLVAQALKAAAPRVKAIGALNDPNEWEQVAETYTCANGGLNCVSGNTLVAPLYIGLVEEIGLTPGTNGPPGLALVECATETPIAGGYHVDEAAAEGGPDVPPGFTSAGKGGVANGSPSSTQAIGYDGSAATTGYNLFLNFGGDPTTAGTTLVQGVDVANNTITKITGGQLQGTVGPVIAHEDIPYVGNAGPVTFTLGTTTCNLTGNAGSAERLGANLLVQQPPPA